MRLSSRLIFLAALGIGSAGCDAKWGAPPPVEEQEERATPVVVTEVERSTIEASISSASSIEAELQVLVHAESTGRVSSIGFEEGDRVEAGARLAQVRRDAQSTNLERASTQLNKAKHDWERVRDLHARGAASKEEVDNAKNLYQTAQLDRRDRKRDLSNTRVIAPFAGTITERFVSEGAFVNSGQQLFSITDFSTLVARVYVPEKELDRIRVGQLAQVVGKAAAGRKGEGKVTRIAPIVDAATGTVKVTVSLPAEAAGGAKGFLPGMYAEVVLTTEERRDVPVLPKPALIREEEQTFVFVLEGNRAKRVLIETGLADEDFVEILSGVELGAEVILAGQSGLDDGALIQRVDLSGEPVGGSETQGGSDAVEQGVATRSGAP
jgi:membrane fusion protein (multidrug efflux system)